MPAVVAYAKGLPGVVYTTNNLYSCSQDTQELLVETIHKHRLNRLVMAACTPRTHEPLFQATMRDAGLNRSLFEMANIRDQCSWVHMYEPEAATQKAKDTVRMAVAKALHLTALVEQELPVTPSALVIGGGLAGITAALTIADQGFAVTLVERNTSLGGQTLLLTADRHGNKPKIEIERLVTRLREHPQITVYTGAAVTGISGYVGSFTTTVAVAGASEVLNHGVVVLATGGRPYEPNQYLYGSSPKVLTQLDLEKQLAQNKPLLQSTKEVVMIQCVGSRGEDLSYCSRVCCGQALKNSLRLKAMRPDLRITILYRDMRSYGFMEDDYRAARQRGIIFSRYHVDNKPEVALGKGKSSPVYVSYYDALLADRVEVAADMLVLSVGIIPEDSTDLARMLKVAVSTDKFFMEAHVKLQPVDLMVDGTYVCGLAHAPKSMDETIAQAQAAAGRACQLLAKGTITPAPIVSKVDPELCIGCGACEAFCPYNAIQIYKDGKLRKARTITASCKGCGVCAARCPTMAIDMGRFTLDGIMAQIHTFAEGSEEKI